MKTFGLVFFIALMAITVIGHAWILWRWYKRHGSKFARWNPRVTYNNPWEVSGERLSVQNKQLSVKD